MTQPVVKAEPGPVVGQGLRNRLCAPKLEQQATGRCGKPFSGKLCVLPQSNPSTPRPEPEAKHDLCDCLRLQQETGGGT